MAEEQGASFNSEEVGPPTSFIQSGKQLRKSYVQREVAKAIAEAEIAALPPMTKEDIVAFTTDWKKEAEELYPDEGNYKVALRDESGDLIPIGSVVTYIGGDIRENEGVSPFDCTEMNLDVNAVTDLEVIVLEYQNCAGDIITVTDNAANLKPSYLFCTRNPLTVTTTNGILTTVGPCP